MKLDREQAAWVRFVIECEDDVLLLRDVAEIIFESSRDCSEEARDGLVRSAQGERLVSGSLIYEIRAENLAHFKGRDLVGLPMGVLFDDAGLATKRMFKIISQSMEPATHEGGIASPAEPNPIVMKLNLDFRSETDA